MEYYGKYGTMVLSNPYKHIQHKSMYPRHHISPLTPPPQQQSTPSRILQKPIIPYSNYLPPPTIYYAPPPQQQMIPPPLLSPNSPPPFGPIIRPPRVGSEESQFGHYAKTSNTILPPSKRTFKFTPKDIDAVLYGYLGDKNNKQSPFHSLSGLHNNPSGW